MSDKTKSTNLIPKSLQDALVAGGATGLASLALDVPGDQALKVAFAGGAVSLAMHWGKSVKLGIADSHNGRRQVTVRNAKESRSIKIFDYQQPAYITRESWLEALRRWLDGKAQDTSEIEKPTWLDEFVFHSYHNAQSVQLLERDMMRFLLSAWRHRQRGSGLSERRWVRNLSERPVWYRNLGPVWYYATMNLLWDVERISGRQVISFMGHQQYGLARCPQQTFGALKWAESLKGSSK